ncbi:Rieske 2Fe-2S domain-containing protein [Pelagibacterium halotolerans]|nr:Rieske 2Fe-2S domain-containing protein [Pelagibacterium halotolerans]QJR20599.1 Rieske 2Fe-2S domain-containing protein [Pelagibacterium halotolerans]
MATEDLTQAVELTEPLCHLSELVDGRSRGFDPLGEGRDTMFVVRQGERLYGYRNHCPHYDQARMNWKKDEFLNGARDRIMCFAHGALFDIASGECEIGPCLGQRLTSVKLTVRDGQVWISGPYVPGRPRRSS